MEENGINKHAVRTVYEKHTCLISDFFTLETNLFPGENT